MLVRRRQFGLLLVAALVVCAGGCRWRGEADVSDWTDALVPRTLETLAQQLEQDEWQADSAWTAWPETPPPGSSKAPLRWTFGNVPREAENDATIASTVAEPPASSDTVTEPTNDETTGAAAGDSVVSSNAPAAAAETPAESEAVTAAAVASWDGFSSGGPLSVLTSLDTATPVLDENGNPLPADAYLAALARRDDRVGWNAAILWAQRRPETAGSAAARLRELFDPEQRDVAKDSEPKVSPSMQLAAAEAWCRVLVPTNADPLVALAPAGRLLERPDLPDNLRCELFLALAVWIPPASIPRLENALQEPDAPDDPSGRAPVEIRRAAIEACLRYAALHREPSDETTDPSLWPRTIGSCRRDPDPRVRRLYGQWLAATRHEDALPILKSQLLDTNIRVREDALLSLGRLGTDGARDELRRQARRPEPRVREFAARALSRWGMADLRPLAGDEAFNVRLAVADELAQFADLDAALIARELLVDNDPQVQLAAACAVDGWPDPLAIPVLLHGMRDSSRLTRRHCVKRLRERTHLTGDYDVDAGRPQRMQQIAALAREGQLPLNWLDQLRKNGLRDAEQIDEIQAAEIRACLGDFLTHEPSSPAYHSAAERLRKFGPAALPLVEQRLAQADAAAASRLYRDLLPHLDPAYAAVHQLESGDVFVRRSAAQELSRLAQHGSLRPLVVRRLAERLAHEQDRLVWRYAMQAIAPDNSDETARIAELAANHTWPDIRILACEFATRHGRAAHASWLLPLLHDENEDVQIAAVTAAGHCRHPVLLDGTTSETGEPLRGLRPLLTSAEGRLQFAAVVSMVRLGDATAMQELVRLSYHDSAVRRAQVVREMGATGQRRFVEHLVRMGWTEPSDPVRRAILASLEQLVPQEKWPAGIRHETTSDARINAWTAWWETQQPATTASAQRP